MLSRLCFFVNRFLGLVLLVFIQSLIDQCQAGDGVAVVEAHDADALGSATEFRDILKAETDSLSVGRDDDDLVSCIRQGFYADQVAGLLIDDCRADTDAAAGMGRELGDLGPLAVTELADDEDAGTGLDDVHAYNAVTGTQTDTAHTA